MTNEIKADIVVVGAGLTGLVTAYYLNKAGKKVVVVEKDSRCGGVINTQTEDGFTFESGPNSGVLSTIEAVELFDDLKETCTIEIANKEAKKRLIWKGDSWQALPSGPLSAITTPLFKLKDKFGILGEPFRAKGTNPDESVAELVKRRLGQSFLNYAVDPFISGIYAGNPQKIITRYALPKLYNLEQDYGSFIGGSIKKKKEPSGKSKRVTRDVFSAENGLNNIIEALVKSIGNEQILLNCSDISINPIDGKFNSNFNQNGAECIITSDKIITTAGAHALPELLPFIHTDEINEISNLEYAKVVQVILGFKNWDGISLDAFGGLVPTIENRKVLGVLYSSTLFKNRAPENGALLSIFMGGTQRPEMINLSDDEIIAIVKSEMVEMMGLKEFKPDLQKIFRYHHAIPQYEISSGRRLKRISEIEKKYSRLILAGNIRDGIGMADRIKQGRTIADSIK